MCFMSDTPEETPLASITDLRPGTRARRQRERDAMTKPDRVAELAADIESGVQRARWSLDVRTATDIVGILEANSTPTDTLDDGVWVSGDHRPRVLDGDLHHRKPLSR